MSRSPVSVRSRFPGDADLIVRHADDTLSVPIWREGRIIDYAVIDVIDEEIARYRFHARFEFGQWRAYRRSRAYGGIVQISRLIMGIERGDPRKVDHVNREPLDNRRDNLRVVTNAENMQNRRGAPSHSRSGVRGVGRVGNRWRARAWLNGVTYPLGSFATREEAERAVVAWRRQNQPYSEMDAAQ